MWAAQGLHSDGVHDADVERIQHWASQGEQTNQKEHDPEKLMSATAVWWFFVALEELIWILCHLLAVLLSFPHVFDLSKKWTNIILLVYSIAQDYMQCDWLIQQSEFCGPLDFAVDFPAQFSFQMKKIDIVFWVCTVSKGPIFSTSIHGPSVNNIGSVKNTVCIQHDRPQTQLARGLDHLQQDIITIMWTILEQPLNKKAGRWMKHK